jgi:hypothetical protein
MAEALGGVLVAQIGNEAVQIVLELNGKGPGAIPSLCPYNVWR